MEYYIVESDTGVVLAGADETVHQKGEILELNSDEQVQAMVETGAIRKLAFIQYVLLKDSKIFDEPFVTGNEISFLEENPEAALLLAEGIIAPKGSEAAANAIAGLAASHTKENQQGEVEAPQAVVEGSVEPRLRYRGRVVLSEDVRIVGPQSFRHLVLDDGSQMDLTEREYAAEVHVSYPPQQ